MPKGQLVWAVPGTLYLLFAVAMGIKEGLVDGFFPALLMPVPICLFVLFAGVLPLWASQFGLHVLITVLAGEILLGTLGVHFLSLSQRTKRHGTSLAAIVAFMVVMNIALLFAFPLKGL